MTEWQYSQVRAILAQRADLLIWLDLPWALVMWQVVGRTVRRRLARQVLWNGNIEPPRWTLLMDREHIVHWPGPPTTRPRRGWRRFWRSIRTAWSYASPVAATSSAGLLARSRGLSRTDKYQVLLKGSRRRNALFCDVRGGSIPLPNPLIAKLIGVAGGTSQYRALPRRRFFRRARGLRFCCASVLRVERRA